MKDHKKNNARTFRYSDEVAAILQQHNNDFDALVLECFYKLPKVQAEVRRCEEKLSEKREEYREIYKNVNQLKGIRFELERVETMLKSIANENL